MVDLRGERMASGHRRDYQDHGDSEYVYLDAHILSTPVVADLDGDGNPELIVAVSYFFDDDFYSKNGRHMLPKDIQIEKYLAGHYPSLSFAEYD